MPTILELAILSMDVYEQDTGGANPHRDVGLFSVSDALHHGTNGFAAQAYTFAGGKVIAYQGTDGDVGDWLTNLSGVTGSFRPTSQDQQAAEI